MFADLSAFLPPEHDNMHCALRAGISLTGLSPWEPAGDVRFGPQATLHDNSSLMSALERIAVIRYADFRSSKLNVCFHQKRRLNQPKINEIERLLSARSGHRELVQSAGIDRIFFGII
jgi:hypothetical protein